MREKIVNLVCIALIGRYCRVGLLVAVCEKSVYGLNRKCVVSSVTLSIACFINIELMNFKPW